MKAISLPLLLSFFVLMLTACTHTQKEYYPSGQIKSEVTTKSGKYQGEAVYYYETGKAMMSCTYKDNMLEGSLLRYYQSGYRKELQTYQKGIGTGLLNHLIAIARKKKLGKVWLNVNTENDRAVHLYTKAGFETEGTMRKEMRLGGGYCDEYRMAILL